MQKYSRYDTLPNARASDTVTKGILILEGGAWRCLYTQGVLDVLMESGINFETTIGVSAGAMSAIAYVSGQIGLSARINLAHRHDTNYCGLGAFRRDHNPSGFSYFFDTLLPGMGLDRERLMDKKRKLFVSVTNCNTGKTEYMDRDSGNIEMAVRASATVPYVSQPVMINGIPYLDGGCSERIPLHWALDQNPPKIMIIRTRDRNYRKSENTNALLNNVFYHGRPALRDALMASGVSYNQEIKEMEEAEKAGRIFMHCPAEPIAIRRFEGDMEKLGDLYYRGVADMRAHMPALLRYLGQE